MKLITCVAIFGTTAVCSGHLQDYNYTWIAPLSTDRKFPLLTFPWPLALSLTILIGRSPCPMVNTLANHGYLPHDGLNISVADLVTAFNLSVNLAAEATDLVGVQALLTSTTGNPNTFNLDDLDKHGSKCHSAAAVSPSISVKKGRLIRGANSNRTRRLPLPQ
jgi:hypothetical protein